MSEASFIPVAQLGDLAADMPTRVEVAGQAILLCRVSDEVFAIGERCSHADQSLECGRIRNGWIACPAHGARFDLETGEALNPPATVAIATYPVRLVRETIEVAV